MFKINSYHLFLLSALFLNSANLLHGFSQRSDGNHLNLPPAVDTNTNNMNLPPRVDTGTNNLNLPPVVDTGTNNMNLPPRVDTGTNNLNLPPAVDTGTNNMNLPPRVDTGTNNLNLPPAVDTGTNNMNLPPRVDTGTNNLNLPPAVDTTNAKNVQMMPRHIFIVNGKLAGEFHLYPLNLRNGGLPIKGVKLYVSPYTLKPFPVCYLNPSLHHQVTHNYKCNFCSKSFKKKCKIIAHLHHVHRGEKRFNCNICHKKLKSKNDLKAHKLKRHPRKKITNPFPFKFKPKQ